MSPGATPAAPPPLGRDRVPGGARATPCPWLTCDGVGVVVPSLLSDVEDAGGHCPCPAWQFAVGTMSGDPLRTGHGWCHPAPHCQTQPGSGTPYSHPRSPTCYLGLPPPSQDAHRDPHLHLSQEPLPPPQHLHSNTVMCTSGHPQRPLSPPHGPDPCPSSPPGTLLLHSRMPPGIFTCTSGASPAPHKTLRDPCCFPRTLLSAPAFPHQRPLPPPQNLHLYPGLCANSSSPIQCPHPLLRFPTSSPKTLTPSPFKHPPSTFPRAEPPGCSCSLPAPRQDRAPCIVGRWVLINFQAL